jgi:hypothetical protein
MIFDALWKAQRQRRELEEKFGKLIGEAERRKDDEEVQSLVKELLLERGLIEDRIHRIETRRVQEKAEKFGIPVPSLSDKESWDDGQHSQIIFLTVRARLKLRQEIRKERRAQWEDRMLLMERIILLLVGLIGAASAFVSVLKK